MQADDTSTTQTMYKGIFEQREIAVDQAVITLKPKLRDSMGIMQRAITLQNFPNAPEHSIGLGQNIVFGTVNSDHGAVPCPVVDDTTNRYISVAQHACKDVTAIQRLKKNGDFGDVAGFTLLKNATDAEGETFCRVKINAAGDFDADDTFYASVEGLEDNDDGSGNLLENPADIIQKIIEDHTLLSTGDIDVAGSFAASKAIYTARGYDTTGEWGGVVPWTAGDTIQDPLEILAELGLNCDSVLYSTDDGKIALKIADISEIDTGSHSEVTINDLLPEDITLIRRPFTLLNKLRANYKISFHHNSPELVLIATDEGSVSAYGKTVEDEMCFHLIRAVATATDVATRLLLRRGGFAVLARMPINGYQFLDQDIGDTLDVTHPNLFGSINKKQFFITSIEPQLTEGRTIIEGISRADVYGPVKISGELTAGFTANLDTYVNESDAGSSFGTSAFIFHGDASSTEDWRAALEFDISAIDGAGGTVVSASLRLQILGGDTTGSGSTVLQLVQLGQTTWNESSTWDAFNGGAWTDANIGGTNLEAAIPGTLGTNTFIFNSDGITYLEAQKAGTVQFTHDAIGTKPFDLAAVSYASNEHTTVSFRPLLTVAYTV